MTDKPRTAADLIRSAGLVILDFDGVIAKVYRDGSDRILAAVLRRRSWWDDAAHSDDPIELLKQGAEAGIGDRIHAMVEGFELAALLTAPPIDGARALMASNPQVAIASNNSQEAISHWCQSNAMGCRLILGRTAHNLGSLKPEPAMLLQACDTFDCRTNRAVFVGDSPSDRVAARAAGIDFVAVRANAAKWVGQPLGHYDVAAVTELAP